MTFSRSESADYALSFQALKDRVAAARAVDRDLVTLYGDIGETMLGIQQTQGWGQAVVERIVETCARPSPTGRGFEQCNWLRWRSPVARGASIRGRKALRNPSHSSPTV